MLFAFALHESIVLYRILTLRRYLWFQRSDKMWDDELLEVTERVVLQNPDINTLWNIRREAFEKNDWYSITESFQC